MGCAASAASTTDTESGQPPAPQPQDSSSAAASTLQQQPSSASLVSAANHSLPPGRVRAMWKKLDTDKDGHLSLDECLEGFAREFGGELAPRVAACIKANFEAHAEDTPALFGMTTKRLLSSKVFSRFFAEILFVHFDKNENGTLQLAEVQEALAFLVKPNADGVSVPPVVAFPPEFTQPSGEVTLPFRWFFATFSAME